MALYILNKLEDIREILGDWMTEEERRGFDLALTLFRWLLDDEIDHMELAQYGFEDLEVEDVREKNA